MVWMPIWRRGSIVKPLAPFAANCNVAPGTKGASYGKGRVFYSALGHTADEFAVKEMATIVERGLVWAAR